MNLVEAALIYATAGAAASLLVLILLTVLIAQSKHLHLDPTQLSKLVGGVVVLGLMLLLVATALAWTLLYQKTTNL